MRVRNKKKYKGTYYLQNAVVAQRPVVMDVEASVLHGSGEGMKLL